MTPPSTESKGPPRLFFECALGENWTLRPPPPPAPMKFGVVSVSVKNAPLLSAWTQTSAPRNIQRPLPPLRQTPIVPLPQCWNRHVIGPGLKLQFASFDPVYGGGTEGV